MASTDRFEPQTQAAPEKKSGGCLKWFLILGGIGLFFGLLCCGGGVYVTYQMKPTLATTPAEVDKIAMEIADLHMLPEFKGKTGMKMNIMIMDMRMADYEQTQGKGQLQLIEMAMKAASGAEQDAQLEAEMNKQNQLKFRSLEGAEVKTHEMEIRGKPANFTVSIGKAAGTDTEYHQVSGVFKSKNGVAKLMLEVESDAVTPDDLDALMNSLK